MTVEPRSPVPLATRLMELDARRRWALDTVIVIVLIAGSIAVNGGLGAASIAVSVALCLPLLWRRRYPLAVFSVIAAIALGQ